MNPPVLTDARAALEASQATRAAVRSLPPDDPQRVAALRAALGSLSETWTDEHRAYVKRGPRNGRTLKSADPVVKFGHERTAETRRLRKMLAPTSGTAYRPQTHRWTANQMSSRLAAATGHLQGFRAEHHAVRSALGGGSFTATKGGGTYRNMRELHAETRKLAADLHEYRTDLNAAWAAYERHLASDRASRADVRRRQALSDRLQSWRADADELHAELRKSMRRKTPIPRRRERWTAERAHAALRAWTSQNGRPPRKAECHPRYGLPHYTQLRRLLGTRPLTGFR